MADPTTNILGVFQTDELIQSALTAALNDIRLHPDLLDYVFQYLISDPAFKKGREKRDEAKKWFLKTRIPVFVSPRMDDAKMPCISIKLLESSETENTLGDVNAEAPEELTVLPWSDLTPVFTAINYNPLLGQLTIPDDILAVLVVVPGLVIMDDQGLPHTITDMASDQTAIIDAGITASFNKATIRGMQPGQITTIGTVACRETYQIGIHINGEPTFLLPLFYIVFFALLKYRKDFLEGRGLERTSVAATDFRRDESFEAELVFSRFINLSGTVRQYWPQDTNDIIQTVQTVPVIEDGGNKPLEPGAKLSDESWIGDLDVNDLSDIDSLDD